MTTNILSTDLDERQNRFLTLTALFEGEFSIDWVQELEEHQTSQALLAVQEGINRGFLDQVSPGVFRFLDHENRQLMLGSLPSEERERFDRQIKDILIREVLDDRKMTHAVAAQLLNVTTREDDWGYLLKAGELCRKDFRIVEAQIYYEKLLNEVEGTSYPESDLCFIDAAVGFSKVTTSSDQIDMSINFLKKAMKLAQIRNDRARQAIIEMHLAKHERDLYRYDAALKHYEHGVSLSKGIDDPSLERAINIFHIFFPFWYGRYVEAVRYYENFAPDIEKHPKNTFPLLARVIIGNCYAFTGQVSHGLGILHAIRNHCIQRGYENIVHTASNTLGFVLLDIRYVDEGLFYLKETNERMNRTTEVYQKYVNLVLLTYGYYLKGYNKQSVRYLKKLLRLRHESKLQSPTFYLMEISFAMDQGRYPHLSGLCLADEIARVLPYDHIVVQGLAARYRGVVQAQDERNRRKSIESFQLSLQYLTESGHQAEIARTSLEFGRCLLHFGREEDAQNEFRKAARIFASINEDLIPDELSHLAPNLRTGENILKEILKFGQEVGQIREKKNVAQHIISSVNKVTGAERGAIFLLDQNADSLQFTLKASKNITVEEITHENFGPSMQLIEAAVRTGQSGFHLMYPEENIIFGFGDKIRSCICAPMIQGNRVIGVLYHDNCLLRSAFRETDIEILSYFASQAAIVLDNAMAYEEIRQLNEKLYGEKQYYEEQHLESLNFGEIIGQSPAIKSVFDHVGRVAETNTTVLILGETGVGKEMVARAIHNTSSRADKPFIRVHCSVFTENLISSELFGHEKGSFTGASEQRIGRFELADGGTLFLDEIGDIPLEVQVKLLRVLQSKEFERVGGWQTIKTDFRLIAATNRDLTKEVKAGTFRQDLFYRLNVYPIIVPPLRERKADIPLLAHFFLKLYSKQIDKSIEIIPERAMEKLLLYDWPGNVRELENVIERGIILSTEKYFQVQELDLPPPEPSAQGSYKTLEDNERIFILKTLEKTGGKIRGRGGAAELLNINPSTLYSRLKKFGINKPSKLLKVSLKKPKKI